MVPDQCAMAAGVVPLFSDRCNPMSGSGVHVVDGSPCLDGVSLISNVTFNATDAIGCAGALSVSALTSWGVVVAAYVVLSIACCCAAMVLSSRSKVIPRKRRLQRASVGPE